MSQLLNLINEILAILTLLFGIPGFIGYQFWRRFIKKDVTNVETSEQTPEQPQAQVESTQGPDKKKKQKPTKKVVKKKKKEEK